MTSRRSFLIKSSAVSILGMPKIISPTFYDINPQEKGPEIKKITVFNSKGTFYRFIGMNAYDRGPKGIEGNRRTVLVELSDGIVGIGGMGYSELTSKETDVVSQLIGKDVLGIYRWDGDKIIDINSEYESYFYNSDYAWVESGILDAIGKLKNMPVWKLMGESVRDGLDPYDGTLYFEDIANNTNVSIIGEIGKRIKEDGYRAIKIKLGRPFKWMPGEAGVNRDIDAFIALREAVGNNFILLADANNGYKNQFDWAVKLMKSCAPYNMYLMEELFPDDKNQYLKLRETLLEENFFVEIGEGENIWDMNLFDQYGLAGVYNYIQPDMATCGFSNVLRTSKKIEKFRHMQLIPHVWQNQMGLIMSLHASKIQQNIPFAEDSRFFEHAINTSNYFFKGGQWLIPNEPGWGISLSPDYRKYLDGTETVIS